LINRFYLQDYLSFDEIDLEFQKGLIVFTGSSGAGKSILMNAILVFFGIGEAKANLSEINIEKLNIQNQNYDIFDLDQEPFLTQIHLL